MTLAIRRTPFARNSRGFATFHPMSIGKTLLESSNTEIGKAIRDVLGPERLTRLFDIMDGKSSSNGIAIAPFLKEIVSSQLDVDRMDYLVAIKQTQVHK